MPDWPPGLPQSFLLADADERLMPIHIESQPSAGDVKRYRKFTGSPRIFDQVRMLLKTDSLTTAQQKWQTLRTFYITNVGGSFTWKDPDDWSTARSFTFHGDPPVAKKLSPSLYEVRFGVKILP